MTTFSLTDDDLEFFDGLMADLSRIGASAGGGVVRLACDPQDGEARDYLARRVLDASGSRVVVDRIGNMFGLFEVAPGATTWILAGSHLDSQPTGGRLDGALGVAAALTAARAMMRHPDRGRFTHNVAVCNWTNEEGARFQPSLLGSSVFVGTAGADEALAIVDSNGVSVEQALIDIGYFGHEKLDGKPVAALELHIEQGDVLEKMNASVGLVEQCWAARKFALRFKGCAAHTGPTPPSLRRDALREAAEAITRFHGLAQGFEDLRCSAARIEVFPNSPNVIPAAVTVWFEVRGEHASRCDLMSDRFLEKTLRFGRYSTVPSELVSDTSRLPLELDAEGLRLASEAAASLSIHAPVVKSVAGHDAFALQAGFASTLLFVRTVDGLSHNEKEDAPREAIIDGLRLYAETLSRLLTGGRGAAHA